jgi:hypothetical protein
MSHTIESEERMVYRTGQDRKEKAKHYNMSQHDRERASDSAEVRE